MEATEELLLFGAGILAIVIALPFLLSVGNSFSASFSGQATALQIANNFHLDTPILYNNITAQITNFGQPIRLSINISTDGSSTSKIITFATGINNVVLLPTSSSSQTEKINIYSLTGELLADYDVQIIDSNLVSITGIGAGTKILIDSEPINFSSSNGNLTFAMPTGVYNFTAYSPYYYNSSEQKISDSNYLLALPGTSSLVTKSINVEQMLPDGTPEALSLAVLNINYNSSIAKSNTAGTASFEYSSSSNSIYINASCPLNSCAGEGSNYVSNNYTSISKLYSTVPSTIILYPKFMTNVNLQMTCKVITSSKQQIEYVVPLTITNSQSTATGTYQQMINISESDYSSYINYSGNTANFELMYPNNTHIPAWIQANNSGKLITFAKLNNIPAGSSTTVDLVFFNKSYNTLSSSGSSGIGEAPELSSSYAQYDDGPYVFNFYSNFKGTTLNTTKWSIYGSNDISGSLTGISVNNELSLTGYGSGGLNHETWVKTPLSSGSFSGPIIADIYENSPSTSTTLRWGLTNLVPTYFGGVSTNSIGEQIYDDGNWYTDDDNGASSGIQNEIGSWSNLANSFVIWGISATDSNLYFYSPNSFSNTGSSGQTITANIPIYSSSITLTLTNDYSNPIYVKWVLTRTYPPNGIMPSVSFGAILKGNQNLTTTSIESCPLKFLFIIFIFSLHYEHGCSE